MRLIVLAAMAALLFTTPVRAQSTTATGVSNSFNPAVSVNGLLLGRAAQRSDTAGVNGLDLQEGEIQFTSVVDPFWKANLITAFSPAEDEGYEFEVEVAALESRSLPWGLGLHVGKDHLPFGKHAPLHTHQFAFVDAPAAVVAFMGPEGLADVAAQVSHDMPLPWYAELTGYVADGQSDLLDRASRKPAIGGRLSNILDLSLESTLEVGGSWLRGPVAPGYLSLDGLGSLNGTVDLYGLDATWKWVSAASSRGPAATITAEMILPRLAASDRRPLGWYTTAQMRFKGFWWLGLGAGGMDRKSPDPKAGLADFGLFNWEEVREYKANLTWVPSEFSAVRLEVARYQDQVGEADDTLVSLQFNFTIGSHPAHLY